MSKVRTHRALFTALMLLLIALVFPIKSFAVENPLDEIQEYTIQIDMRKDGTMDINYHLDWKVLDDKSDGPLSWVKIGIPNKNVDEIEAHTDNIKKIEYNKQDGRTYAQRLTQGSSVYFTNSKLCCSMLLKLDFSKSPII